MRNKTTLDQIFEVINHEGKLQPHASVATIGKLNEYATNIIDRALKSSEIDIEEGLVLRPSETEIMLSEFSDISDATVREIVRCRLCLVGIYENVPSYMAVLKRLNKAVADGVIKRVEAIECIYSQVSEYHQTSDKDFAAYTNILVAFIKSLELYHLLTLDMLFTNGLYGEVNKRIEAAEGYRGLHWNHPENDFRFDNFIDGKALNIEQIAKFNELDNSAFIAQNEDNSNKIALIIADYIASTYTVKRNITESNNPLGLTTGDFPKITLRLK
jgi:hypothetical protein